MNHRTIALLVIVGNLSLSACKPPPAQPSESAARPAITMTAELRTRLAAADAADNKVDHVVSKCIGCTLHMAGLPAHTTVADDYTVRSCSKSCQAAFEKDPVQATAFLATK